MTKRIIGLFLALCLVVGLLPMIALAEEATEPEAPPAPATITINTGNVDALITWSPEISVGMAPAYAKTTAEGSLITEGASESDYNLKVAYPADGNVTLTLKNATITNDNIYPDKKDTIVIEGTVAVDVVLVGTNIINGNPSNTSTTTASYRCASGIKATNTAALTIKGASKADSLTIDNKGGTGIYRYYDSLTIDSATVTILCVNTGSNAQNGIIMEASSSTLDKTNLTVQNAKLDITAGKHHANYAILLTASNSSGSTTNVNKNTGDVLFKNSEIRLYRSNSSGSSQVTSSLIGVGSNSTFTIDNCEVLIYARHIVMRYAPTLVGVTATYKPEGGEEAAWDKEAGANIGTTKITTFKATHICVGTSVEDFDCTTGTLCGVCGKEMGTAQAAHKPAADDGDCTTPILCTNEGCKQIVTPGAAAHTPAADDGDCTTAVNCTVCGKETTPAASAHTGGTATCTAKAKCTVCGKEYGEILPHTPAARPSCDVAANCTACGQEVLKAGEHKGGTATCTAKAKCAECGKEYGELAAHTGGTATCKEKAKCTACGVEYGELSTAHAGGTATCKEKAKCATCGAEYGELAACVPAADDGDCTTAIKCSICGKETTAAKAHAGGTATCKAKAKCATCGKEYGELAACTPAADDGDCTTAIKCSVCGKETTAAKEHAFTDDKDSSCNNAGCKHTRSITTNPATGDVSILLTAALALSSAAGFAGVSVLRKKEN